MKTYDIYARHRLKLQVVTSTTITKTDDSEIDFWVSEPDSGIYNAMNKGIVHAHGEYCIFMNAGDIFYDSLVLSEMIPLLDIKNKLVFGQCTHTNGWIHHAIPNVKLKQFWGPSFPHQAAFISTDLFKKYGGYREDYRAASDMFFFFEMIFLHNVPYLTSPRTIALFESGGLSSGNICLKERYHYILHHMPFPYNVYCFILEIYSAVRNRFFSGFSLSGLVKRLTGSRISC